MPLLSPLLTFALQMNELYVENAAVFEPHWRAPHPAPISWFIGASHTEHVFNTYSARLFGTDRAELAERLDDILSSLATRLESISFLFGRSYVAAPCLSL